MFCFGVVDSRVGSTSVIGRVIGAVVGRAGGGSRRGSSVRGLCRLIGWLVVSVTYIYVSVRVLACGCYNTRKMKLGLGLRHLVRSFFHCFKMYERLHVANGNFRGEADRRVDHGGDTTIWFVSP